jgi:hypothetical protein
MVIGRKFVDLEDKPDAAELVHQVRKSGKAIDLRLDGKVIAVLRPLPSPLENPSEPSEVPESVSSGQD